MEARIPFAGLYESKWSGAIDRAEEQQVEYFKEEHPRLNSSDIGSLFFDHANYGAMHQAVARAYADEFGNWLASECDLIIPMAFNAMQSPKEYNFVTDQIYVEISLASARQLYRAAGREAIAKAAREHFTSRSGFISFYSPDISTWGQLPEWDHNQLYMLFVALTDQHDDWEWGIYESLSETIDNIYSSNVDWPKIEEGIADLEAAEAEDNPNGYVFPKPTDNPDQYVRQFERLNNLKGNGS